MQKTYVSYFISMFIFAGFLTIENALADGNTTDIKIYSATTDSNGVQKVDVIGGGYYFDPNHIIVKVNTPVELTLIKDEGFVPHTVVMDFPGAGMSFSESLSSEPTVIKFTPTALGEFAFICDKKLLFFKSHDEKGMKGVIEVVE